MLAVDGLLGDPERLGDLLPGPPGLAGGLNLQHLETFQQPAERGDGVQTLGRVSAGCPLDEFGTLRHGVSIC